MKIRSQSSYYTNGKTSSAILSFLAKLVAVLALVYVLFQLFSITPINYSDEIVSGIVTKMEVSGEEKTGMDLFELIDNEIIFYNNSAGYKLAFNTEERVEIYHAILALLESNKS